MGLYSFTPPFWSMPTAFLRGPAAAAGIALINAIGNLGGFTGPYLMGWLQDLTGLSSDFAAGRSAVRQCSACRPRGSSRRDQHRGHAEPAGRRVSDRAKGRNLTNMMRRQILKMGALAAASAAIPLRAAQQPQPPAAPPSTVTTPPRDFGPNAPPTTYFTDPDIVIVDPVVQQLRAGEHADQAAVDRRLVVRGTGLVRTGALSRLERHSQQSAAALERRRRARLGVPPAVEQQQRQHVRFSRTPDLLRASDAPRRALRARRLDHDPVRRRSAASASTRPTTSPRIPMAATGSPIRRTAASSTKGRWMSRADRPIASAS